MTDRTDTTDTITALTLSALALSQGCARTQGELIAFLDGELLPAQAASVEAHLALCPDCAAYRDELRATLALADAFTLNREIDVAPAVLKYIAQETPKPSAAPQLVATPVPPTEMQQLLAGMQAMQAELAALRGEVADLRRQLTTARGRADSLPPKPAAPRLFPFAAPASLAERG